MARVNKYEYETSPRKYEPEYVPVRKKTRKKSSQAEIERQKQQAKKEQERLKKQKQQKAKVIFFLILGFGIIFAICYRNAQIDEKFAEIKELKSQLSDIQKENTQLEIAIESDLNLTNLEQEAKELLGMQKLTNKQTVYANLKKTDYIECAAENVVIKEETTWDKMINTVKKIFK